VRKSWWGVTVALTLPKQLWAKGGGVGSVAMLHVLPAVLFHVFISDVVFPCHFAETKTFQLITFGVQLE
jgi:hypothetical protein